MEAINLNDIKKKEKEKNNVFKDKDNTFDRLCKIQKLIKKESALKDLCKS